LPPAVNGDDQAVTTPPLEMVADSVLTSVARLRHFAADAVSVHAPDVDGDTVALLVSEVATNALVHGAGAVRLRVVPLPRGVRVEVLDGSRTLPRRRAATLYDEGGRGIALVEAFAAAWGSELTADGKTVWFEVAATTRG
jgi:anti-sigma regulatory factor (Ser/Thr protein kinase)